MYQLDPAPRLIPPPPSRSPHHRSSRSPRPPPPAPPDRHCPWQSRSHSCETSGCHSACPQWWRSRCRDASDTSILPNFAFHRVGDSSTVKQRTSSLFGRWWSSAFRLTTPIFVARGPALLFGISRWLSQHGISRKRRNNLTRVLIAVERSTQESKANSSHPSSREGHRCAGLSLRQFGVRRSDCRRHFPCPAELGSILHMRCIITASRRASATMAFFCPRRLAMFIAHALATTISARGSA